jgi:hypothetical protein
MKRTIEIGKSPSLNQIEAHEASLAGYSGDIDVLMARDVSRNFFVESRLASFIAGLSRRGALTVADWGATSISHKRKRFADSPEGVASVLYGRSVTLNDRERTPISTSDVLQRIIDGGGFGEGGADEVMRGNSHRSVSIYAFDDLDEKPFALASTNVYSRFKDKFQKILFRYFEVGSGEGYRDRVGASLLDHLTRFVFEIYMNAYYHGRLSVSRDVIVPGMRYVRMKRYIAANRTDLISGATGFVELQQYLDAKFVNASNSMFCEISISDHGIGIPARFLSTCPWHSEQTMDSDFRCNLINTIIAKSLSSNTNLAGAGNGLRNAIRDVDRLGGFLSIRTGDVWLFRDSRITSSSSETDSLETALIAVQSNQKLLPICGTQVNMLLPMGRI